MGRSLKLKTIAEGVETAEQMALLRAEGCDEGQGYLFAPPLPGQSLERLLSGVAEDPKHNSLFATHVASRHLATLEVV